MMNHSLKSQCRVNPGTVIEGKWHHNRYTIVKQLGSGANGIVYLAHFNNQKVALKMSDNGMSITSEVNVLKSLAKVRGSALGPSLLDVDDWQGKTISTSFYVMEYIDGPNFLSFIERNGRAWTSVLILQLLSDLGKLHGNGWIFGDLKPENLIVAGPPTRIRCIDVGGTTIHGRAIKEFTEFFDRGYWGLGTRKAEPAYDLFAVAMVIINTAYPNRFQKNVGGLNELMMAVKKKKELRIYEPIILKALNGNYGQALEMRKDLLEAASPSSAAKESSVKATHTSRSLKTSQAVPSSSQRKTRYAPAVKKNKGGWLETFLIIGIIGFLYFLYIFQYAL